MSSKKSSIEKDKFRLIQERQPIVLLHRLTKEEIKRYTSKPSLKIKLSCKKRKKRKKKIYHDNIQSSPNNKSLFNKYKKCRQHFLKKKNKKKSSEHQNDSPIDTFDLNDFTERKRSKKKKSTPKSFLDLPLECSPSHNTYSEFENDSFCSDSESSPKKKIKKIIRRPVINSDSDFSMDGSENAHSYAKLKIANKNISSLIESSKDYLNSDDSDTILSKDLNSIKSDLTSKNTVCNKKKAATNESFDLVSKIIEEMDDYDTKNRKKRKESICVPTPLINIEKHIAQKNMKKTLDQKKPKLKKSRPRKNSQIVDADVLDTLNFILNGVCDSETRRLMKEKGQKKCKWCETLFDSNQNDIFCIICKEVFYKNKSLSKKENILKEKKFNKKLNSKDKMKNKLLKNLPTTEKNRLLYKCNNKSLDKTYSHCKVNVFENPKVNENQNNSRLKKIAGMSKLMHSEDSEENISQSDIEDSDDPSYNPNNLLFVPEIKSRKVSRKKSKTKSNLNPCVENKKSYNQLTNNDRNLFLMTFSESNQELDKSNALKQKDQLLASGNSNNLSHNNPNKNKGEMLKPAQSLVQNTHYNTYSLPSMPTVVVANYATNGINNGDFYLSSVYYQNEMTQPQNPSMPTFSLNNNSNSLSMPINNINFPNMPTVRENNSISSSNLINNQSTFNTNLICQPSVSSPAPINVKIGPTSALEKQSSNELQRQVTHLNLENNIPNLQMYTNRQSEGMENISLEQMNLKKSSEMRAHNLVHMNEISEKKLDSSLKVSSDISVGSVTASDLKEKTHVQKNSESNEIQEQLNDNIPTSIQNSTTIKQTSLINLQESSNCKMPKEVIVKELKKIIDPLVKFSNNESESYTNSVYEEIEGISILGVLDLYGNLEKQLYISLEKELNKYNYINNLKENDTKKEAMKVNIRNLKALNIAKSLLEKFGSFEKVVENYNGKDEKKAQELNSASVSQNEKPRDKLVTFETQQSFQYSPSLSPLLKETENVDRPSLQKVKTENLSSCMLNKINSSEPETPINKLQTQIASITSSEKTTSKSSLAETLGYCSTVAAPTNSQINMQNVSLSDLGLASESRETPSRGSGSITPGRPESAKTQPEDISLTLAQIKREKIFASESLDKSPCAFSQNNTASVISNMAVTNSVDSTEPSSLSNTLSQFSSHVPDIQTQIRQIAPQTFQRTIAQGNNQILIPQNTDKCIPPNRTVPFSNSNMSKVLFNLAQNTAYKQRNNVHSNSNNVQTNNNYVYKNNPVINVQHIYIPPTSLPSMQSPLVNQMPSTFPNNQCVVQQPPVKINSFSNNSFAVSNNGIPNQNAYPISKIVNNAQIMHSASSQQFINPSLSQVISRINQSVVNVPNQQIVCAVPNQQVMPAIANQQIMPTIVNQQMFDTSTPHAANTTTNQQFVNTSSNHPILNQVSQSTDAIQAKHSSPLNENEQMSCVVCKNVATLRCKQCAKVAFCNTECAKYYWHKKHKLECKMMATES